MRLDLPANHPGLQIWDISTPLMLPGEAHTVERFSYLGSFSDRSRFRTVNLRHITGLTFLMRSGGILHIHGHTTESLDFEVPAWCTSLRTRNYLCAVYVPLSSKDKFTAFEVQASLDGPFQVLVRCLTTSFPFQRPRCFLQYL